MSIHFHFLFPKSHQSSTKQRTAFEALEISHLLFTSLLWSLWALIPPFFLSAYCKDLLFLFQGNVSLLTVFLEVRSWVARQWETGLSLSSLSFSFLSLSYTFPGSLNKEESVDSEWWSRW